jgi:hypothetical protein
LRPGSQCSQDHVGREVQHFVRYGQPGYCGHYRRLARQERANNHGSEAQGQQYFDD